MLSHLSMRMTGSSLIQQQSWKCRIWLKFTCSLVHEKCVQSSYLSNAGNIYEGSKDCCNRSTSGDVKDLAYSQIFENYKDLFDKLSQQVIAFASESHADYHSVITKQQFSPHADRHFFLKMRSLHHLMFHTNVLRCVRSFHSCRNEMSLRKDVLTNMGSKKEAMIDNVLTENVVPVHIICGAIAAQEKKLTPDYLEMLAKLLYCSVDEIKKIVTRYDFFIHLAPERIKAKVNIMLHFGLPKTFISMNPRLLYQTSADELHKRLEKLQDYSLLTENSVVTLDDLPHYLECKNYYFLHIFRKLCAEKDSLEGCFDQLAYIQFRLNCSENEAQKLLSSYPLNRGLSNVRLKKLIDFMLNEAKFSAQFVIAQRGLMSFSVVRLRTRWNAFKSEDTESESLLMHIFNMTQKEFENKYPGFCLEAT